MDDILDSLSRQGRKFKDRLRGKKHKPDRTGANITGESAGSSSSLLRPEHRVAASSHYGEGSGTNTDVREVRPRNRSPPPEPMPAGGSSDDQQGRRADVDEKEVSQRYSRLNPDVEVAVGGTQSPSLPPAGKPDRT